MIMPPTLPLLGTSLFTVALLPGDALALRAPHARPRHLQHPLLDGNLQGWVDDLPGCSTNLEYVPSCPWQPRRRPTGKSCSCRCATVDSGAVILLRATALRRTLGLEP